MIDSTAAPAPAATPQLQELVVGLGPQLLRLAAQVRAFRALPPTPERTHAFEIGIAAILLEVGRVTVEREYNRVEPEQLAACPLRLQLAGQEYRRRPKSRKRIGTLFGTIELHRYLYEAVDAGEPCLFPLELHLGVEAGLASPALAERVGLWSAEHEQGQVLDLLRREHGVSWSATSLRKVTAALRDGLAGFREEAQVARVLEWLQRAFASRGRHRPVLAAGRDGIHVPLREEGYHEAATATLSVLDRQGRRLGTVYLGRMPESGQETLSAQLTTLLTKVLAQWQARGESAPRLAYVTDAGHHQQEYARCVLRRLADPWHLGQQLSWEWIVDFWHACTYVNQMAEGLFGVGARAASWFRKWRRWLRDRHQGLTQVIRSASWHYNNRRQRSKAREESFWKAYRYLRKHGRQMRYAAYRRQGLPIGSGITEAACKTVFAERLKRSGMTWRREGGQIIVDLRILVLSGVWAAAHQAHLRSQPQPSIVPTASQEVSGCPRFKKAA